MDFVLQKEKETEDIDVRILRDELDKQKFLHSYDAVSLEENKELVKKYGSDMYKKKIPVGSLEFVQHFLSEVHGVCKMNPIEVPDVLREMRFLKRKYSIVDLHELPKTGYYFTKYVSKLKIFSHTGMIETLQYSDEGKESFLKEGLYQVSEVVDIIAEYRCFVHNDRLVAINYYDGDCTLFPDVSLIQRMIGKYMRDDSRPKAYTMDVAIIKNRGTALLEIHPWVSVGLYGYMFGSSLPYCYRDGFDYYLKSNKDITRWSNF